MDNLTQTSDAEEHPAAIRPTSQTALNETDDLSGIEATEGR